MIKRKKKSTFNKRGNAIIDTAVFVGILFVFSLVSIFGYIMFKEIQTDLEIETSNSWVAGNLTEMTDERYPSLFDGLYLTAFILLWIFVIASSFAIDTHPIFFGISFVLLIFVLGASVFMSNFYEELMDDPDLGGYSSSFPMMAWINSNMLLIAIAVGVTISIVLYAKSSG